MIWIDFFDNPTQYGSVGSYQYLSLTRPYLSPSLSTKFVSLYTLRVRRILCHLKHTSHFSLHLQQSPFHTLYAYSDVDWAGCPDDCRSTSGFYIFLRPNLVSCSSRKQLTVARSNIEAEYMALIDSSAELILWLQSFLKELNIVFLLQAPVVD